MESYKLSKQHSLELKQFCLNVCMLIRGLESEFKKFLVKIISLQFGIN